MQIFLMDKGYSAFVLTKALGGQHLDLGEEEVPLQPLARIDDPTDRMKIQGLLEDWIALQNVKLLPQQTRALYRVTRTCGRGPGRAAHHYQPHYPGAGYRRARWADSLLAGRPARAFSRRRPRCAARQRLRHLRARNPDGHGAEGHHPGADLSVSPHRAAARRAAHPHHHR